MAGFVTIQLIPGTKQGDIRSIEGVLVLRLPVSSETLTLDMSRVGNEAVGLGVKVAVTAMRVQDDDHYVWLSYEGPVDHYVTMAAYDESEQRVFAIESAWEALGRGSATFTYQFRDRVSTMRIFVAADLFERRYPFSLHLPVSHGDQTITD